jgi:hypothetical protein
MGCRQPQIWFTRPHFDARYPDFEIYTIDKKGLAGLKSCAARRYAGTEWTVFDYTQFAFENADSLICDTVLFLR